MTTIDNWTPVKGLLHWENIQPDKAFMHQPTDGEVTTYTWSQAADQVRRMASYLNGLNLPQGSRIGILSRNCAHFFLADLAIWMAGHVSLPVYPSLNADTLSYILDHADAKLLFLGPLDSWAGMRAGVPADLPTVLFPGAATDDLPRDSRSWDEAIRDCTPDTRIAEWKPDDMARLVYTSGSTGQPKGVMVPFRAMEASGRSMLPSLKTVSPEDRMISYLPLAHVFEAAVVETASLYHGFEVFFSEGLATFAEDLRRARPTIFHSVPRLWVKFQQAVQAKVPADKLEALLANPETREATQTQILTQLGLQDAAVAVTGSAPLAPTVQQWYRDIGLELLEGYAMSEDFAISHLSQPGKSRVGYVGHVVSGVERRIADDGEVQIQSPGNMLGYYREPEKTAEAYTADGWFRTGDLGSVDEEGRLRITGRLKELFKTAKGKYVAPVPIESKLGHPLIEVNCVSGANQPQPFVLMMPGPAAAEVLASDEGRTRLAGEIEAVIDAVNETLDPHEHLQFAVVVKDAWTIDNAMLTPTMKIKRNVIEERYAPQVDDWYAARRKVVFE